ncbi:MAG: A/G-specific adenine glycosylase, partial [Deltaproteobacteria bacterium]
MRAEIRRRLLAFYRRHRRDLPWRRSPDPYRVLVAETMLQQTQVATVERRYEEFLAEFPTVEALAAASPERVCEAWSGLGYYQRARNLHAAARKIVREYGGRVPKDRTALLSLPGVGPYTAGAVASIAYGLAEPILDTNAARVIA